MDSTVKSSKKPAVLKSVDVSAPVKPSVKPAALKVVSTQDTTEPVKAAAPVKTVKPVVQPSVVEDQVLNNESPAADTPVKTTRSKSATKTVRSKSASKPKGTTRSASRSKAHSKSPVVKKTSRKPASKPTKGSKSSKAAKTTKASGSAAKPTRAVTKKTAKKSGGSKTSKSSKTAKSVKKRVHNNEPATMDVVGIGIGPARVRNVLITVSLDPENFAVRKAILLGENKPRKPKPTDDNPNPAMPAQGPQTHVENLDDWVVAVVRRAEEQHENSLRDAYEHYHVGKDCMSDEERKKYNEARRLAQEQANNAGTEFNLQAFNLSYDKKFYDEYPAYKEKNDSYVVGKMFIDKKTKKQREKFNEWTRAVALVNKLSTRLSGNTRNIIACFLDRVVEQYARNGIHNCLADGKRIVQLSHALQQSENFSGRVPLHPFVSTLKNYHNALQWFREREAVKKTNRAAKAAHTDEKSEPELNDLPNYPSCHDYTPSESEEEDDHHGNDFIGYIGEICRSVKMHMAEEVESDEEKKQYLDTNVGRDFKTFCSYMVYETILRIGSSLKLSVERQGVKTISDAMVWYVLNQLHSVCGVDFEPTKESMDAHLQVFAQWRESRKALRKEKKDKPATDEDAEVEVQDEDDVQEDDEEEVDVEEEEEADPDVPETVEYDNE